MTEEQLSEYLKNNLSIRINTERDWYSRGIKVELVIDGEVISSDSVTLPSYSN